MLILFLSSGSQDNMPQSRLSAPVQVTENGLGLPLFKCYNHKHPLQHYCCECKKPMCDACLISMDCECKTSISLEDAFMEIAQHKNPGFRDICHDMESRLFDVEQKLGAIQGKQDWLTNANRKMVDHSVKKDITEQQRKLCESIASIEYLVYKLLVEFFTRIAAILHCNNEQKQNNLLENLSTYIDYYYFDNFIEHSNGSIFNKHMLRLISTITDNRNDLNLTPEHFKNVSEPSMEEDTHKAISEITDWTAKLSIHPCKKGDATSKADSNQHLSGFSTTSGRVDRIT